MNPKISTIQALSTVSTLDPATTAMLMHRPRQRRVGLWISIALLLVMIAFVLYSMAMNPRFEWPVVFAWFTSQRLFFGLLSTLQLTVISMVFGIVLGAGIALARLSHNPIIASVAWFFVWLFRGTPVFVQLLFWGFIAALYPVFVLGVPFGPTLYTADMNVLITPYIAAILGLGLNQAAYTAEIVRAGLLSVDKGQMEAAHALGMRNTTMIKRIVLPQAMRLIIPPMGNETISMLKTTSLVSVLAFPELLYSAQLVYSSNYKTIPLLIAASMWYLIITSVLSIGQYFIERYFNRSVVRRSTKVKDKSK